MPETRSLAEARGFYPGAERRPYFNVAVRSPARLAGARRLRRISRRGDGGRPGQAETAGYGGARPGALRPLDRRRARRDRLDPECDRRGEPVPRRARLAGRGRGRLLPGPRAPVECAAPGGTSRCAGGCASSRCRRAAAGSRRCGWRKRWGRAPGSSPRRRSRTAPVSSPISPRSGRRAGGTARCSSSMAPSRRGCSKRRWTRWGPMSSRWRARRGFRRSTGRASSIAGAGWRRRSSRRRSGRYGVHLARMSETALPGATILYAPGGAPFRSRQLQLPRFGRRRTGARDAFGVRRPGDRGTLPPALAAAGRGGSSISGCPSLPANRGPHLSHIVTVGVLGRQGVRTPRQPRDSTTSTPGCAPPGVVHSVRRACLRLACHLSNTEAEVDGVIEIARQWCREYRGAA